MKSQLTDASYVKILLCTIDLKIHVLKLEENSTAKTTPGERCGAKGAPHMNEGTIAVWHVLHDIVGIGHRILSFLCNFVDQNIEHISPKELELCQSIPNIMAF